ncbi:MAG: TetR/AcrR family transcriptional regulator, partial [Streptomyces sp.]|nr:TetR/AcrR family transcriptional regulator [Streptomyces sp.]
GLQHPRLRTALKAGGMSDENAEDFAVHVAAVNQSLAVMGRAGSSPEQLRAIVGVTTDALTRALTPVG